MIEASDYNCLSAEGLGSYADDTRECTTDTQNQNISGNFIYVIIACAVIGIGVLVYVNLIKPKPQQVPQATL